MKQEMIYLLKGITPNILIPNINNLYCNNLLLKLFIFILIRYPKLYSFLLKH